MLPDFYYSIEKPATGEYKDRGSKFLAYAFPIATVADFKLILARIKKEHPKAAHHCFAYRLGFENLVFRVSDDGEPSGSAGRPILGQIDSLQLTNVIIIVVRYFGGTLLGVPGLIHAYKSASYESLQQAVIVKKPVLISYRLQFDYTILNQVMRWVKQFECEVYKNEMQLFCILEIGVPKIHLQEMEKRISEINGVEMEKILSES
ncbi:MAG TPA: YigZ family protein [Chitinophagaceae bacterium]|nr:YigZ family protein [Chitinophagaceae bacterium]HNA91599.1 YigZ family protein [Chitinophagaceae bacterium]HNF47152.1 YigZ family protein [Chitinophagaceae bacterium]HNJ55736.1 YigZ family protein [Chitinophagaceae bacterium]HNK61371.1 YigZ family protein [Chitinophagaceae bacterium]